MDSCHFLLARPWQYDRETVHRGKENKYSFKDNGVTYRIQSIVEEDKVEKYTIKAFLMSGKKLLKDLKESEGVVYAIMLEPKEERTSTSTPILAEVQEILD